MSQRPRHDPAACHRRHVFVPETDQVFEDVEEEQGQSNTITSGRSQSEPI